MEETLRTGYLVTDELEKVTGSNLEVQRTL
jgi:hypothetical protein